MPIHLCRTLLHTSTPSPVLVYPLSSVKARKLREVRAEDIGHLVVVKGLVVRASSVRPRAEVLTYTCEVCGSEIFQPLQGVASFMPVLRCESKRCLESKSAGKLTLQTRYYRPPLPLSLHLI
ncbi:hypothetical protein EON64_06855, partial [archaeon]